MVTKSKTHTHIQVPMAPGGVARRKEVGILISSLQKRQLALSFPSRDEALRLPIDLNGLVKAGLGRFDSPSWAP